MRQEWYRPKKQVPKLFRLTPLILAVWFMDDGTKHRDTIDISVHNFSKKSYFCFEELTKPYILKCMARKLP